MSKGGMFGAFKSSNYWWSLVENAASSTHQGQFEENQDVKEEAANVSKQEEKRSKCQSVICQR